MISTSSPSISASLSSAPRPPSPALWARCITSWTSPALSNLIICPWRSERNRRTLPPWVAHPSVSYWGGIPNTPLCAPLWRTSHQKNSVTCFPWWATVWSDYWLRTQSPTPGTFESLGSRFHSRTRPSGNLIISHKLERSCSAPNWIVLMRDFPSGHLIWKLVPHCRSEWTFTITKSNPTHLMLGI